MMIFCTDTRLNAVSTPHDLNAVADGGRLLGIFVTTGISRTSGVIYVFILCLQKHKQHDMCSPSVYRTCGVLQGSDLGPLGHIFNSSMRNTQNISINTMICQFIFQLVATAKQLRDLRMVLGSHLSMGTHMNISLKFGSIKSNLYVSHINMVLISSHLHSMNFILHAPTNSLVDRFPKNSE